jgi:hypothetical protein
MARYAGRVIIQKVDSQGKKIKNHELWMKTHPNEEYFDSYPEWEVWNYMKGTNIPYITKKTLTLCPGITTMEFQAPKRTKKAIEEGRVGRVLKEVTQQAITYTPDYYLPEFDMYIEVKGYADELFKMRWKLFKLEGYNGVVVYSLEEFKEVYKQLSKKKLLSNI